MIKNKDITFVVQGLVIGKSSDRKEHRYTLLCIQSIRKHFPESFIILSTWKGSDVKDLDFDLLVENDDPGVSILGDFSKNGFRQITSTIGGGKRVNTKYATKVRSDLIFKNNNILKYFEKYSKLQCDKDYKILDNRVVMLTTCNPKRRLKFPFTACDWIYFGLTKDVINIFNIPLIRGSFFISNETVSNREKTTESLYSTEQYIWFTFLSKYKKIDFKYQNDISGNNIEESERYFANNAILLTAKMAGVDWLKYSGAAYAQIPCLSNSGLYTWTDYKRMLNKYTPNKLFIIPNIFESFMYLIVYNLRYIVKQISPGIHDFIAKLVNGENHRRVKKYGK